MKKKRALRIGIDGRYAESQGGGINRYIHELIKGIINAGDTPVVFSTKKLLIKQKGAEYKVIPQKIHRIIWEQIQLPRVINTQNLDLYHATANSGIPLLSKIPTLLTVHDVIPLTHKGYFDNSKFPFLSRQLYILNVKTSILKSQRIICTTNSVLDDVKKYFKSNSKKLALIPMAPDKEFLENKKSADKNILKRHGIISEFMLNFGGIDKRKNIDGLIKAYALFIRTNKNKMDLVITGGDKEQLNTYRNVADEHGLKDRIHFLGWIEQGSLPVLARNAKFIIYPTFAEGFGLPLVEAMAARTPILVSKLPSFLKMGENVPIYIDPTDSKNISSGMRLAAKGRSKDILDKGRMIASNYSWDYTFKKTYTIYSRIHR